MKDRITQRSPGLILVLILVVAVVVRVIFFTGYVGWDDYVYARTAYEMSQGNRILEPSIHVLRLGLLYPASLCIKLLGLSEVSIALFPFICSLLNILVVFYIGRMVVSEAAGLLAALLLSCFPLDVYYATQIMTEVPQAFWLSVAGFCVLKALLQDDKHDGRRSICLFLSGLAVGMSYLVRESAIYFFSFPIVYSLWTKKFGKYFGFLLLGFGSIVLLEVLHYYFSTGDPWFRYVATRTGLEGFDLSGESKLYRFLLAYPNAMFNPFTWWPSLLYYGIFFYLVVVGIFYTYYAKITPLYYALKAEDHGRQPVSEGVPLRP